jgi:hypothetical protein
MREFITWDKVSKRFHERLNYGDAIEFDKVDKNYKVYSHESFEDFEFIGKTDDTSEQNKMYANSSIIDMTINDEDGTHSHIGYFDYNELILCYEFREKSGEFTRIWRLEKLQPYSVELKVIGTLQQNPELLS